MKKPVHSMNLAVVAVGLVALAAGPAAGQERQQEAERHQNQASTTRPASTVSAETLSDHPDNYYGKRVTVKEEVTDVLGPHIFTIEDGEFFGVSQDILVFAPNAEAVPGEDRLVTVTGEVRKFTRAELERDYGWGWGAYPWTYGWYGYGWYGGRFDPDYYVRYENRPYILARSVKTASGRELVNQKPQPDTPGRGEAVGTTGGSDASGTADVAALRNRIGERVRLSNLKVDRVVSKRGFWATGQKGEDIFVGLSEDVGEPNLKSGDQVWVAGRVMRVPEDKGKIDKARWGLSDQDLTQLSSERVFVRASAVRTGSEPQQKQK